MARQMTRQEPCTINCEVIAETLERFGYVNMAEFVRHLDLRVRNANLREELLRSAHNSTLERLHFYEPPEKYEPVSYQPPPEASD